MHTYYEFQTEEENAIFEEEDEDQYYRFPKSTPEHVNDHSPEVLGDFLKRPLLIKTINWDPAGVSDNDFDPWTLYFNNSSIKAKVNHFGLFRGNMHIKVVVNASPFHYGAMLINYTPTPDYVQTIDNSHVTSLVNQSQKPHLWIDLRANKGGEMILPFIYPYNYVNLTSATKVNNLGRLRNITYVGPQSANGSITRDITVKIYAWIEDPVLTQNTVTLAMQAKKQVVDEYGNGPISRPASALAHWASYLVNVPVIGTYAKATQIGASAVSSVAGLFGWSKVPVIENVKPVKPVFFHDLASAEISEPMVKFTLDPKAELSVDPRIPGPSTGEDELSISHLVQKNSYIGSYIWYSEDTPDDLLYRFLVTPNMYDAGSATSGVHTVGYTPMGYIAEAFTHWRGDIIVTVKVVCSQYHRGRLRMHWSPNGEALPSDATLTTLTKIVDIGESTEVEFRVPYINRKPWLRTRKTFPAAIHGNISMTHNADYDNGLLEVRVLNALSAPVDTANVTIMFFVRGAENLEFANPCELATNKQFFEIQSLVEEVETMDVKSTPLKDRYLINFGEPVPSLRLLMQRSELHQVLPLCGLSGETASASQLVVKIQQGRFPTSPGYDQHALLIAKGYVNTSVDYRYIWCNMTHLAWFTPMFVARRGSIQWHYQFNDTDGVLSNISIIRQTDASISDYDQTIAGTVTQLLTGALPAKNLASKTVNDYYRSGATGVAVTEYKNCPSISVEMPMLTGALYNITDPDRILVGYTEDESSVDVYAIRAIMKVTDLKQAARTNIARYCNAGTDFSLSMFLCAPQIRYATNPGGTPS